MALRGMLDKIIIRMRFHRYVRNYAYFDVWSFRDAGIYPAIDFIDDFSNRKMIFHKIYLSGYIYEIRYYRNIFNKLTHKAKSQLIAPLLKQSGYLIHDATTYLMEPYRWPDIPSIVMVI